MGGEQSLDALFAVLGLTQDQLESAAQHAGTPLELAALAAPARACRPPKIRALFAGGRGGSLLAPLVIALSSVSENSRCVRACAARASSLRIAQPSSAASVDDGESTLRTQ